MASSAIHLAVAKEYLKKNRINNIHDFYKGVIMPDAIEDSDKSHYSLKDRGLTTLEHVQTKVSLYDFLKDNSIDDDFNKGWFVHLLTDYLFFNDFFKVDYLKKVNYHEFYQDLYHTYDCTNFYKEKNYNITLEDYTDYPEEHYPCFETVEEGIFTKAEIDEFIRKLSLIDLNIYAKKSWQLVKILSPRKGVITWQNLFFLKNKKNI